MTTDPRTDHRAVLTVTVTTRPDGGHYFDQADFAAHVTVWVRSALEGRHAVDEVTVTEQPVEQTALRDRIAEAFRAAACNGDCDNTEEECARKRVQPYVWHHGVLAEVLGTPEVLADVALAAVLPPPVSRADVLRDAADALGRMDYDTDSNDYGYDTFRDAWNGGVIDGADELRRMADEAQPGTETHSCPNCEGVDPGSCLMNPDRVTEAQQDVDPVYDPRAWETYRRDAGCGCTAPAPVDCKIPHGTGAWLCVCHRLSGPPMKDTDPPGAPLSSEGEAIRRHFTHPNRCLSAHAGIFRCERPTGHLGGHRQGRTFWERRPEDDTTAAEARQDGAAS